MGFESRRSKKADNSKTRVVVAMSGGVDSSAAAALLVQEGYEVIGVMMRLWSAPSTGGQPLQNRCCTPNQIAAAREVAERLGIRFYVIDVQDFFYRSVVEYFIDGHVRGETPNPCIACNQHIRFDYLLDHALSLGADYLATGHYAKITHSRDAYHLFKGNDSSKDQSYVLYVLGQSQLKHLKFPIGEYAKRDVREITDQFGLGISSKSESMDLCFLADGDYRGFLGSRIPEEIKHGPITDESGRLMGEHNGLQNYTIGQRKGLGVSSSQPLYVLSKDKNENQLIVGPRKALARNRLATSELNWLSGSFPQPGTDFEVKIRYRARPVPASISLDGNDRLVVNFDEPVYGITAGQAAVVYRGDECLGGGLISDEVVK